MKNEQNEEDIVEEDVIEVTNHEEPKTRDLVQVIAQSVKNFTTQMHCLGIKVKTVQMEDFGGVLELKFKSPKPFEPCVEEDDSDCDEPDDDDNTPMLPGLIDSVTYLAERVKQEYLSAKSIEIEEVVDRFGVTEDQARAALVALDNQGVVEYDEDDDKYYLGCAREEEEEDEEWEAESND